MSKALHQSKLLHAPVLGGNGLPSFQSGTISHILSAIPGDQGCCSSINTLQSISSSDAMTQKCEQTALATEQSPGDEVQPQVFGEQSVTRQH